MDLRAWRAALRDARPEGPRLLGVLAATSGYALLFVATFEPMDPEAMAIAFINPVAVAAWLLLLVVSGWLLGRFYGIAYGVLVVPLHGALFAVTGQDGWAMMAGPEGLLTLLFSVMLTFLTGSVAELYQEARVRTRELARKNAELERTTAALARTDAMFHQFAERVSLGVWIVPARDRSRGYFNPAMKALTGFHAPADTDAWMAGVHPDDRDRVAALMRRAREGEPVDMEYRAATPQGERWLRSQSFAARDTDGSIVSYVGVVEDVTARKRREIEQEMLARRERLTSLGTLVAGVAHEVNNPLTYVMGNLQLAQGDLAGLDTGDPDRLARVQRLVSTSVQGGERIARIVRALRAVTRSPGEGAREKVHLNAIAGNVHELIRTTTPRHVALELRLCAEDPVVDGDGSELHQVVLNLATNAIQALGARPGRVVIETSQRRGEAALAVRDDGPGIAPEHQARLFTPFFTTKPEGTGLGLSLAHAIVEQHRGQIDVESAPGEGAVFRMRLPLGAAPLAREAAA